MHRKIGIRIGKQYAHEITTNLLAYYFYHTKIIEDELLNIYENAEEEARQMAAGYIYAEEERTKYQYEVNTASQKEDAEKILNDAWDFVARLKNIEKPLTRELVTKRSGMKSL